MSSPARSTRPAETTAAAAKPSPAHGPDTRTPAAKKATVLALHKARGGKVYQVLAPIAPPGRLSDADLDRIVDAMVAGR